MAGKLGVPNRPRTEDEDYQLGGDGWMQQFGDHSQAARTDAGMLGGMGKQMISESRNVQNRATPETQFGRSQAFGGQQVGAANWLQDFAQGPQGPSAAQAQLQQGANQSMDQNLALARSGSGFGESANSLASAQQANAGTMANASNQAAMLRAQEDQAFRQQQLGAMGTAADIYGQTAGREGDQAQFRTQAELEAAGQRDAMQLGLGGQSIEAQNMGIQGQLAAQGVDLDAQNAALQGRIAQGQTEADLYGTEADVFATREARDRALAEARRADRGEVASTVGSIAGAAAAMFSDERTKKNVKGFGLMERYKTLDDRAGRAERDLETYQDEPSRQAVEDTQAEKPSFGKRLFTGLSQLSDEQSKRNVKKSSLRARYEALGD